MKRDNATAAISRHPRVKVCCIESIDEARLAIDAGADLLGFVSEMPSGPGVIAESLIAEIAPRVPPGVTTVLLTAATDADTVITQQRHTKVRALQLVADVDPSERRRLREALPGIAVIQVVHVVDETSIATARHAAEHSDAILLDSGRPDATVPELGGTGRAHDWSISRRIVDTLDVPVFLAGGLRPSNVAEASRAVRAFGLDVCSGVRRDGHLDADHLRSFFAAASATMPESKPST